MLELGVEMLGANGQMVARIAAKFSDDKPPYIDRVSLDSSRSRNTFAARLAQISGEDKNEITVELSRLAEEQLNQPPVEEASASSKPEISPKARARAMTMLRSPDIMDDIARDISLLGVEGERNIVLLVYLGLTSRILSDPLGIIVQGASSAGKSHVVKVVAGLIPPGSKLVATNLSPQALYYFDDPDYLRHRAIVVGERKQSSSPEVVDEGRSLRELLSERQLTRVVTIKDRETGRFSSVEVTVNGPVAYVESTTRERLIDEDASRLLPLRPDESREQTLAVVARTAREAAGKGISKSERSAILSKHHAAQLILEEFTDVPVVVPYASAIEIPAERVVARRAFNFVISTIRAVALLRVFQKGEVDRNRIKADFDDYKAAFELVQPVVQRQLGRADDKDEELLRKLEESGKDVFTAKSMAHLCGIGHRQARRRAGRLLDADLLGETENSRNNRKEFRIRSGSDPGEPTAWLSTPDEVEERHAIQQEYGQE